MTRFSSLSYEALVAKYPYIVAEFNNLGFDLPNCWDDWSKEKRREFIAQLSPHLSPQSILSPLSYDQLITHYPNTVSVFLNAKPDVSEKWDVWSIAKRKKFVAHLIIKLPENWDYDSKNQKQKMRRVQIDRRISAGKIFSKSAMTSASHFKLNYAPLAHQNKWHRFFQPLELTSVDTAIEFWQVMNDVELMSFLEKKIIPQRLIEPFTTKYSAILAFTLWLETMMPKEISSPRDYWRNCDQVKKNRNYSAYNLFLMYSFNVLPRLLQALLLLDLFFAQVLRPDFSLIKMSIQSSAEHVWGHISKLESPEQIDVKKDQRKTILAALQTQQYQQRYPLVFALFFMACVSCQKLSQEIPQVINQMAKFFDFSPGFLQTHWAAIEIKIRIFYLLLILLAVDDQQKPFLNFPSEVLDYFKEKPENWPILNDEEQKLIFTIMNYPSTNFPLTFNKIFNQHQSMENMALALKSDWSQAKCLLDYILILKSSAFIELHSKYLQPADHSLTNSSCSSATNSAASSTTGSPERVKGKKSSVDDNEENTDRAGGHPSNSLLL